MHTKLKPESSHKFRRTTFLITSTLFLTIALQDASWGKHQQSEKYYQEKWCSKYRGQIEFHLPDNTRCDCLTSTHAVEVEFGEKWAESIGQSLYYSIQTNKKPGIVLILESPDDRKYWIRLNTVINYFGLKIDTWEIGSSPDKPIVKSAIPSKTPDETTQKDSRSIRSPKHKITTTTGNEFIVDSYSNEGGQIKFHYHGGMIGLPKDKIKSIESMP